MFAVACNERERGAYVDARKKIEWSVPVITEVGDLIVMYRTYPASEIRDLWIVKGPFYDDPSWGVTAYLQLLSRLKNPVTLSELRSDPVGRTLGIVRRSFQGRSFISQEWLDLAFILIQRNPDVRKLLHPFGVD